MSEKLIARKPLAMAVGAAFAGTLSLSPVAGAAGNPFGMTDLGSGYRVAEGAPAQGAAGAKAGEGSCGGKMMEGKCGGKSTEGKCGGKMMEGKCGEGKCGAGMMGTGAAGAAADKAEEPATDAAKGTAK
jgi:uncharacterized low-complexity protein